MKIKKVDTLIGIFALFLYVVTLFMIKYPASYISGSTGALFWSGVPSIDVQKSFIFILVALILSYSLTRVKIELNEKYYPIYLFVAAFGTSLFLWDMPEVNNDFSLYFRHSKDVVAHGILNIYPFGENGFRHFTVTIIDGLLFEYFAEERVVIQVFRTSLFAGAAVLTYCIGKLLWGRQVGIIAGTLLFSFPYFLSISHLMILDVPVTFFVTLSVFAALRSTESRKWAAVLPVAVLLSLFTKKVALVYLGFLLPTIYLARTTSPKREVTRLTILIFSVLLLSYLAGLSRSFSWFEAFFKNLDGDQFLLNPLYYLKSLPIVIGPVTTLLAFGSIVLFFKKKDLKMVILLLWMIMPVIFMTEHYFRHLIPAYPAYALAGAIILRELKERSWNWKFIAYVSIIPSIFMALLVFPQVESTHVQTNVKEAGEYIDSLDARNIAVLQVSRGTFTYNNDYKNFANMLDYYSSGKVIHYPHIDTLKQKDQNPDALVIVGEVANPVLPEGLDSYLEDYYLSKTFSKGDYGYFAPAVFFIYLPQIEYHSRYPEILQGVGKHSDMDMHNFSNPKAGLLNFIIWTPQDSKVLDKNVNITWTIEADEEPLEIGFYYRTPAGFFADGVGQVEVPRSSTSEITRTIEPSETLGTHVRIVPYEANGRRIKIVNVTIISEFYNISISRDMQEFKF